MNNRRQQMLTEPIKRFLIQCVAKTGAEPKRLLNEVELCGRFGVSRPTAHKAVDDLLTIGYIQHLPGKRGIFSNPAYAAVVPHSIGILSVCGNCSYVDSYNTQVLGTFLNHMGRLRSMTTFLTLNRPPGEVVKEIDNAGLDAVFWINPEEKYFPAIERMIGKKFPLVIIQSLSNSTLPAPPCNSIGMDFTYGGLKRAEFFLSQKCRRILYCGRDGIPFQTFKSKMAEYSILIPDSHRLQDTDSLDGLSRFLDKEQIDGMVCDGCNDLHNRVMKILSGSRRKSKVKVLLSAGLDLQKMQETYPELKLYSLCPVLDQTLFEKIGMAAARHMEEMLLRKGHYRFKNEYLHWNLNHKQEDG